MPIETRCPNCSKLLRVPDEAAGKRIRCPACQHVITPGSGERPVVAAPAPRVAAPQPAAAQWSVQTEDGQQFGPIAKSELDQWVTEGRVNTGCQLLQAGSSQWQWAAEVYPQLSSAPAAAPATQSAGGNPFEVSSNPYASPGAGAGGGGSNSSMRGRSIPNHLPMAIFALVCCGGIFAIPAIIYASQANSKKRAGDYVGAARDASSAQTWLYVAIGLGVAATVLMVLMQLAING